jgi:hypothetical protein
MTETPTLDLAALGFATVPDLPTLARVTTAAGLLANAGTCAHPLRFIGGRDVIDAATGELLDSAAGRQITISCGNRRASVCSYCSTLYKYDAYNLVVAGLRGGKNTPVEVCAHPRLLRGVEDADGGGVDGADVWV